MKKPDISAIKTLETAIALSLSLIAFIPRDELFGPSRGLQGSFGPIQWIFGITIILGLALVLHFAIPSGFLDRVTGSLGWIVKKVKRFYLPLILVWCAGVIGIISHYCFRHRPHLVDSVVSLFQALIFASGEVVGIAPKHYEFFMTQHMVLWNGFWSAQYPPGHSLMLASGAVFNAYWIVPIVLSTATAGFIFAFAKVAYGSKTA
ncbi:MAG: hypothetical protein KDD53_11600, partial [Bdellovibrionales bacterium]|nr:hypothetical protein [Bdellovibrionales bacterium]